jgi:hypothetical protein
VKSLRYALCLFLLAAAVAFGSRGVFADSSEDVQGGRDAAGAISVVLAAVAVIVAAFVFGVGRRSALRHAASGTARLLASV